MADDDLDPEQARRAELRARRAALRFFNDDDRPAPLAAAGVDTRWHPSKDRYKKFWRFLIPALGVDTEGWWYGHCLLHDKECGLSEHPDTPTAMFNFSKGVIRCISDESCHAPRKAMSMSNAYDKMVEAQAEEARSAETR